MQWITTSAILDDLHDFANSAAWDHFNRCFSPAIQAFLRRQGLGDGDVQDVAQSVLSEFVEGYRAGSYDRTKGTLRGWLFTIARRRGIDTMRRRGRALDDVQGDPEHFQGATDDGEQDVWAEVWESAVTDHCLRRVQAEFTQRSYLAFKRCFIDGATIGEVAKELGMTSNAVSISKFRVLARLRKLGEEMEDVR